MFLLIGFQARMLAGGVAATGWQRPIEAAVLVTVVVVIIRFVWVFPATYIPRLWPSVRRRDPVPSWRLPFLIGFTGIRGAVSLAAALAIPHEVGGSPFPERDLILFVTFIVIMSTLIGQGSLLPPVSRALGLADEGEREAVDAKAAEVAARLKGIEAVLAEGKCSVLSDGAVRPVPLNRDFRRTRRRWRTRLGDRGATPPPRRPAI